jgi:23S rRNA (adenine2030-N6)-methyltransferase
VLIDPPYEGESEFADAERALRLALSRWPNGVFALWYPMKAGPQAQRLNAALRGSGLRKLLRLELTVRPADSPIGLNGSGLVIANPPWKFDAEMTDTLTETHAALSDAGKSSVQWLVGE